MAYKMFLPSVRRADSIQRTESRIFSTMKNLQWGFIEKVEVHNFFNNKKDYVQATVTFRNLNPGTEDLVQQLDSGATARVQFGSTEHPSYWNVVKWVERAPKHPVSFSILQKNDYSMKVDNSNKNTGSSSSKNKFKILETASPAPSDAEGATAEDYHDESTEEEL